jgi:hypothetical protein
MADSNTAAVPSIAKPKNAIRAAQGPREVTASQELFTKADVRVVLGHIGRTTLWILEKTDPNFPRPLDLPGVGDRYSARAVRLYARGLKPKPREATTVERPRVKPTAVAGSELARRARQAKAKKKKAKAAAAPTPAVKPAKRKGKPTELPAAIPA